MEADARYVWYQLRASCEPPRLSASCFTLARGVAPPARQVLHNDNGYFAAFYIVYHLAVPCAVKEPPGFVVVRVVPNVGKAVLLRVGFKLCLLALYRTAVLAAPLFVTD